VSGSESLDDVDRARPGAGLSHLDGRGRAVMVDVGEKPTTARVAVAEGFVRFGAALESAIRGNSIAKGPVLETARLAGIMAAKRTDELIPLCHTLAIDAVEIEATLEPGCVRIVATARSHGRTGVEMEALVAVSIACLTVHDMGKAIDRGIVIDGVRLLEKHGGQRGSYVAPDREAERP
jgi:cyclic pyranopterin phosphate synthase